MSTPRPQPASRVVQALSVLALAVLAAGCSTAEGQDATLTIGDHRFQVEVAQTAEQQRRGLAGREQLPANTGMLFQFDGLGEREVWMAGMTIPLDIAWIADGRILAIDTLPPCFQTDQTLCPRWTSPSPADSLLETSAGSLDGVDPGAAVTLSQDAT